MILEIKKERCTKQEIIFPVTLRVRYLSVKQISLLMLIHGQAVKLFGFSFYILEVNVKKIAKHLSKNGEKNSPFFPS